MGCKVLCLNVALLAYLMICEHVRAQCTQPSLPSKNVILSDSYLSTQSFPDGSTVTFECVIGHKPVNSRANKSVTCQGTQWSSLELDCTRKSCGSPPDFFNGRYEKTGIHFGDKITAVCDKGYKLDGQTKDRWCRDGGWDGRDPVCEVVKCLAPPTIENGQLEDAPLESYNYLQVVSYKCNNGLSLSGSPALHCSEDGTFKPDPPRCLDGCPRPTISNAIRIGGKSPPYKVGNFIDYKCEDGYTIKGDYHIVCSAKGWNPEPPKCVGFCTGAVLYEHVTLTEEFRSQKKFPDGSNVTVECIQGYKPVNSTASNSVTCEETEWSKLLFTCEVVKCVAPPTIKNGQLGDKPLDSYVYSQVVSYKCNRGFSLNGISTLHCSEDGTFKPDPPTCLALPTTTTATIVTSDSSPKDDVESSSKVTTNLNALWSLPVLALVLAVGIWCCWKRCGSKHQYSKEVAKNEEGL